MDPKRTLVVYYSRTGTTHEAAEAIKNELGCAIERIEDTTNRSGIFGYLRSGFQAALRRHTVLRPLSHAASDYDLVIIGSPVWNASLSAPVRSYLKDNRHRIRNAAFFLTYGGSGSARALRQMEEVYGNRPVASLAVRMHELHHTDFAGKVRAFASALRSAAPAETGVPLSSLRPAPV